MTKKDEKNILKEIKKWVDRETNYRLLVKTNRLINEKIKVLDVQFNESTANGVDTYTNRTLTDTELESLRHNKVNGNKIEEIKQLVESNNTFESTINKVGLDGHKQHSILLCKKNLKQGFEIDFNTTRHLY